MATKKKSFKMKPKPSTKVKKIIRLSVSKTKKIEKGFTLTVEENRGLYLAEQLDKYKGIEVAYD